MKLYFTPFACSLASHIVARETGISLDLVPVVLSTKRTATGDDFLAIAPKGQVPALCLDDGSILTENAAVLQYLADAVPGAGLLPAPGTQARYRVIEWVHYVGTEIHKACFATMFTPDAPADAKVWARAKLDDKVAYVSARLDGRAFVVGDHFTIADAYLGWALLMAGRVGVTLPNAAAAYLDRLQQRPVIQAAIAAEVDAMPDS